MTARRFAYLSYALAALAVYLALPPLLLPSLLPSLAFAVAAAAAGELARRRGEARLGWLGIVLAIMAALLAAAATSADTGKLERVVVWSALGSAALRYATPLIFAAIGGLFSERSGVINIGLEGMLLMGAFFAALGADKSGSWLVGILVAMLAGGALALVHAIFCISLRADQIVSGTAINFLALGITGYAFVDVYGIDGTPSDLPQVPDIGGTNLLVWAGLVTVLVAWVVVFRTPLGLRLRSVGENPKAAETAGLSVIGLRYGAVVSSGVLSALGGAYLSIGFVHSFNQNMTAGRGFIALAALIFGRWHPRGALVAALLFGFSSALAQRLPVFSEQAAVLFQALPYVLTLIVVAGVVGRSVAPRALGIPYSRP